MLVPTEAAYNVGAALRVHFLKLVGLRGQVPQERLGRAGSATKVDEEYQKWFHKCWASEAEGILENGAYWHLSSQGGLLQIPVSLACVLKLVNILLVYVRDFPNSCFCAGSSAKCSSMLAL